MSLFQKNVLKDYLKNQDQKALDKAFATFTAYFQDAGVQQNIRQSKEEQFQATFLSRLFVDALGYTMFPDMDFNLTTEVKNEVGARKADGAIMAPVEGSRGQKAIAVIELKSTKTKDLESIRKQAFDYKANQSDCRYVITSNFEKLRFYINDAVEWLEFDLFHLTRADFAVLYLCLQKENLLGNLPQKIKSDSLLEEEKVTKTLYKDYSQFRMELFRDLVKRNRRNEQLKEHSEKSVKFTLFKKTQKLLDRFLFIFFAEDRGLIPRNMIKTINNEWKELQKMRGTQSLYDRYKLYFTDLNEGNREQDIFVYNGGLFEPDPILDHAAVDDELLYKHTEKLTAYDFESEVDVNILGHIFEHSLNEIESVNAEIEGVDFDKQKARRKKDGVFYTPKYITKYIVDNTLGRLCDEKKAELEITAEVYENAKQRSKKRIDNLQKYREWLLQLSICDPACGSGAFLNQALEFLIAEHRFIDELSAKYNKDALVLSEVENSILENNLYGVDINQESVEIAKLSLWLRSAQRGRKLTSLSNNIKCGNSLIDSVKVAGDKAFKWEKEFPQVFAKGGFDVVIGNPPYVTSKESFPSSHKEYFSKSFETAVYQIDLYILFLEKSLSLKKAEGRISFIVPNAWLNNLFLEGVRKFFLTSTHISSLVAMPSGTFEQANVDTVIVALDGEKKNDSTALLRYTGGQFSSLGEFQQEDWLKEKGSIINVHVSKEINSILRKVLRDSVPLESFTSIGRGVGVYHKRVGHTKEFIASDPYQSSTKKDDTFVPYLRGRNVQSWHIRWNEDSYISYGNWLAEPREPKFFEGGRVVLRQIPSERLLVTYLEDEFITDQSVFIARFQEESSFKPKAVLAILGSRLFAFFFRNYYSEFDDLFPKVKLQHFKAFPINENLSNISGALDAKAQEKLKQVQELEKVRMSFLKLLISRQEIEKISGNLQNWPSLDFKGFLKELKKAKVKLSLEEEAEWVEYFNQQKAKVQELQGEVERLDKEIDLMVYELYGLTEEEIEIVENNNQ